MGENIGEDGWGGGHMEGGGGIPCISGWNICGREDMEEVNITLE